MTDAWAATKQLKEFFTHPKRRAWDLPDEQRERTIERLRKARAPWSAAPMRWSDLMLGEHRRSDKIGLISGS